MLRRCEDPRLLEGLRYACGPLFMDALEEGYRTADIAAGKPHIGTKEMGDVVCRLIETA